MSRKPHVYRWDDEPVDERPSEFATTGSHLVRSGFHPAMDPAPARRVVVGWRSLIAAALLLAAGGGWLLHRVAHWLGR